MEGNNNNTYGDDYDRAQQVKQFDHTKHGVKGLVDSGLSSIPRIFIHPPETLQQLKPTTRLDAQPIPTIDLSCPRSATVHQVSAACRNFGFFQITNHGVPSVVLDRMIAAVRAFHEQPAEARAPFYRREMGPGVSYLSNVDLYASKAASWRDTLQVRIGPVPAAAEDIPEVCRDEILGWNKEIQRLGQELLGLASEGLGLSADKLKEMTCHQGRVMVGHYYPQCPQPDLTVGLASHSDPGVLTVLLQDHMGGLQVKHDGVWVDVKPVPGALVINVGDLLQV